MVALTFAWSDAEVRRALGLRTEQTLEDVVYEGVGTDSRAIGEGELYVALVGERFDGHDFVADAIASGAGGVVVSRPTAGSGGAVLYPVDDTLVALGRLAAHRRNALAASVVGITGSSGKTATKELTRAALAPARRVHATPGNFNNRIGLPLTLLRAPADAEVVVAEMGTNEPGEIAALASIARPDVGVITTVSESHLEKLGSVEGVMEEKLDLLRGLAADGRAVVGDVPPGLASRARALVPDVRVAGWSQAADVDLRPEQVEVDAWGYHTFVWRGERVRLELAGRHTVQNAMIALAVAELLDVEPAAAARGLADVRAGALRGEIRRLGDLTLVVDCYNANPQSTRAALDLLQARSVGSGRVALLGSMLELGARSGELHREVLADALARDLDLVVATGAFARVAGSSVDASGGTTLLAIEDADAAYDTLKERLTGGEVVLLKASRGMALERLVPRFAADFGGGEEG
jgi:UDP-N-acetylmuramoyl-tripeptide--D-alanyl-D-alanine ligase